MSLIPSNINDAVKKDAEESNKPRRGSGEYEVKVTSVAPATNPKPWIDSAIVVKAEFLDDIGGDHEVIIELSPCTAKDGSLSPGKIRFLRWQLGALGLDMDEIEFQLFGIMGKKYKARYTVDNGINEDGTLKRPNANLNPHTGKPYINRDLVFLEAIEEKAEEAKQDADAEAPDAPAEEAEA